jgi:hypothetical protein
MAGAANGKCRKAPLGIQWKIHPVTVVITLQGTCWQFSKGFHLKARMNEYIWKTI